MFFPIRENFILDVKTTPLPISQNWVSPLTINLHHKGWVLITLGWDDWYRVHILTQFGEVLDSYDGVGFDELIGVIDDRIERIEEYKW
jgi:hypothetical protein